MRTSLTILSFVLSSFAHAQTNLFGNYSFDKGSYILLGLKNELWPNEVQKKLGEFYIDNISLLKEIKQTWTIKQPKFMQGHKQDHFYHYNIILLQNGKIKESFSINLDSSVILTKSGSYLFDLAKLRSLIGRVKGVTRREHTFNSYNEGKKFEVNARKNSDFLFATEWNWENYEGSFLFYYNSNEHMDTLMARLKSYVTNNYPKEKFKLDWAMIAPEGKFGFKLTCNKSLYDKFKLTKENWKFLNFNLTTFWKQ